MPEHILKPKNRTIVELLVGDGTISAPLPVLRQKIKTRISGLLGYLEPGDVLVPLDDPYLVPDPDAHALEISISASNKMKHRVMGEDWLDLIEGIVRKMNIFPTLIEHGGVSIFIPVGKGFYRRILE